MEEFSVIKTLEYQNKLAQQLREAIIDKPMSVNLYAEDIEISPHTLAAFLNGKRTVSFATIMRIEHYLNKIQKKS